MCPRAASVCVFVHDPTVLTPPEVHHPHAKSTPLLCARTSMVCPPKCTIHTVYVASSICMLLMLCEPLPCARAPTVCPQKVHPPHTVSAPLLCARRSGVCASMACVSLRAPPAHGAHATSVCARPLAPKHEFTRTWRATLLLARSVACLQDTPHPVLSVQPQRGTPLHARPRIQTRSSLQELCQQFYLQEGACCAKSHCSQQSLLLSTVPLIRAQPAAWDDHIATDACFKQNMLPENVRHTHAVCAARSNRVLPGATVCVLPGATVCCS